MFGRTPRKLILARSPESAKRWARHGEPIARRPVRVVEIVRETPDALTLVLEPADGKPLAFKAGQYLTHCFSIDGATVKRAFSLSSAEGVGIACTIKAVPGGRASGYVFERLQVGDRYTILGPSGEFTLEGAGEGALTFIAGGSGITPVMGLVETALARDARRPVRLLYASREQIIFGRRLEQLAAQHPQFEVVHVLSRPGGDWRGERGRLDAARIAALAGRTDAFFYLCGPTGLMDAAAAALAQTGVPAARIRREVFLAAAQPRRAHPTAEQTVRFERSGISVVQNPGESVLEAGLRSGAALSFSCTVGGCGACKVRVVSGDCVLDEPNCLTADERAQGFTLACSSFAASPLVVDA